ncbi:MAG: FtsK/SpoIIIE domain-containing protein [Phycisphaerales bacterium]
MVLAGGSRVLPGGLQKGVEFKAYAGKDDHGPLPHARAVAIESDREFGLSVLQRVDEELKRRGDLFREAGVQNLGGFRQARPGEVMPRTLLIIDEFQELFVEDDKLAQDASLLLDRLVRQGRAFGIHVILGSQTLGGAYSLARSTLGQMAIRIALQCNEADSYLILNEENSAARLLSRPGEAIYNDQAGMVEGNSPFQIVWLPDAQRDDAVAEICQRAETSGIRTGSPALVFEGNVPARLDRNNLMRIAASDQARAEHMFPQLWLGEAIAIKDPTAAHAPSERLERARRRPARGGLPRSDDGHRRLARRPVRSPSGPSIHRRRHTRR